jgi:hypothetical protein
MGGIEGESEGLLPRESTPSSWQEYEDECYTDHAPDILVEEPRVDQSIADDGESMPCHSSKMQVSSKLLSDPLQELLTTSCYASFSTQKSFIRFQTSNCVALLSRHHRCHIGPLPSRRLV